MSQHTPGPWEVDRVKHQGEPELVILSVVSKAGANIANLWSFDPSDYANARLVAASPDLLAACNAFLAVMDGEDEPSNEDVERALIATREAVAKAEGRGS